MSKLQLLNLNVVPSIKVLAALYFDINKATISRAKNGYIRLFIYFFMSYLTTLAVTQALGYISIDMDC
jgi:hypothetical protein